MNPELEIRVQDLRAEAVSVVQLPPANRRPQQVRKLADRTAALVEELVAEGDQALRALRRAAILEEPGGEQALQSLLAVRRLQHQVAGCHFHGLGMLAWLDGLPWTAARHFRDASLQSVDIPLALDSLEMLADFHREHEDEAQVIAASGASRELAGPTQDLDAAEQDYMQAIELKSNLPQAAYGIANVFRARGELGVAAELFLSVLANADGADRYVGLAYDALLEHARSADDVTTLSDLAESALQQAPHHEADRLHLLFAILTHPVMTVADRGALATRLQPHVAAVLEGPQTKLLEILSLRQDRNERLLTALGLGVCGSLEEAESRLASADLSQQTGARPAIAARAFHDLWAQHAHRLEQGEVDAPEGLHVAYVRALDRKSWWLGEACRVGDVMDPTTSLDLWELLEHLMLMWESVSDEPPAAETLASLVSTEELEARLAPILEALFRRLANQNQVWSEIKPVQRLDTTIRAACEAEEVTDFARDELIFRVNQRLVRTGMLEQRLYAMVSLTELYLEQRRFDTAISQAKEALALDPENADANYWLGMAYLRSGKRLVGLEYMRTAAEQLGHAAAYAAIADDCAKQDEPDHASAHFIKAAEEALRRSDELVPWEYDLVSDWLRSGKGENENVEPFPIHVDKKLPRRERKEKTRELEELNAKRMAEVESREQQLRELSKRLSWAKSLAMQKRQQMG